MVEVSEYLNQAGAGFLSEYVSAPLLASVLVVLVGFVASRVSIFIMERVMKRLAEKTASDLDDILIEKSKKPISHVILLLFVGLAIFIDPLGMPDLVVVGVNIIASLVILIFTILASDVITLLVARWGRAFSEKSDTHLDDALLPLFEKIIAITIFVFGGVIVLGQWGVEITPILAGLGVAGLAVSLAVKDGLSNVFGGIMLMLDNTFKVGDKVKIESGEVGVVEDIGLRSTSIRTYDHELIIVPNGFLANTRIKNYTKPDERIRVVVPFSVAYGSDVKKVKKVIMGVLSGIEGSLKDPAPAVEFDAMGNFSLNFIAKFWISDYNNHHAKKLEAVEGIHEALVKNNIDIPFPTHTVYMKK